MHAKVFQITCQRVDKENTLNEYTLAQGDGSFYDYCAEITPECRKEMIVCLVNEILPKGMFSLIGDDELVYNGGAEEWKAEWVKAIHDKARKVTTKNVMDWIGPTYQLEKELKNPLHTDSQFYLSDETYQSYAEQSAQLMEMVCNLQVGTHLYIGGVIDFHF